MREASPSRLTQNPDVPSRQRLTIVLAGHVDHGKSTIVGRLLHDLGRLPDGKIDELRSTCERRRIAFEWAFVTDALQAERAQGVTIDAGHIWLHDPKRDTVLIDAPGHHQFIRNMVSGAAMGDAALLILDARESLCEQARRHAYLLHLIGIRQVAAVINKMDLVDFNQEAYDNLAEELTRYLFRIGLTASVVVPTVGPDGDNIVQRSNRMDWYKGPTLLEAMDTFAPLPSASRYSLRMRVQDVYRDGEKRIIAGRISAGRLNLGDEIMISPSNTTASVLSLESWQPNGGTAPTTAEAGQSVGLTINKPLFVARGDLISHTLDLPFETHAFTANIFWFSETPLVEGRTLTIKFCCLETKATVKSIVHVFDLDAGESRPGEQVPRNGLAQIKIYSHSLLAIDAFDKDPEGGRFMMTDGHAVLGGGTLTLDGLLDMRPAATPKSRNISTISHHVTAEERTRRNGCRGAIFWLTGLSGAGKSTIAMGAENALFHLGYPIYVLDGDNLRHGLNADLGFSPEDRVENIRRAGEVAALFANAGMIVITAFISPYLSERQRVRTMAKETPFHEIYIRADIQTCEERDPKGLYARARKGEIAEFTGISAPYEEPVEADLTIDTQDLSPDDSIEMLVDYIRAQVAVSD
jgi:bifunctional enzyme CysN/CysC